MPIRKTKLTEIQRLRLLNVLKDDTIDVVDPVLIEIIDTPIRKIEYRIGKHIAENECESYYGDDHTMDFILNGMKLEREPE